MITIEHDKIRVMLKYFAPLYIGAYYLANAPIILGQGSYDPATGIYTHQGSQIVTFKWFQVLFEDILLVLLSLIGLSSFIMVIFAGFKFLMSAGDPKAIEQARQTGTWAILGVVLSIGSWIALLLIENITGVKVTEFIIPI